MRAANHFLAGVFIIVGLLLFGASIWLLGNEREIFSKQEPYHTTFKDVKGLTEGAPVRLGGITIGRVAKIAFSNDLNDVRVHVTLMVNEPFLERLRDDAVVTIETQGLLGDRYANISSGAHIKQLLPHSEIKSEESGDIASVLTKAGAVVENTKQISEKVSEFMSEIKTETLAPFTASVKNISEITKQIQEGNGLVHQLLYDKKEGDEIAKGLSSASKGLADILEQVKSGQGLLHSLVYGEDGKNTSEALSASLKNIATSTEQLNLLLTQVKEGNGLVHQLLYDESPQSKEAIKASFSGVMAKLDDTANNLKTASEALARGTGTLGALLVDPSLYENLVEVTDGAKRSFLLRQAIRSSFGK